MRSRWVVTIFAGVLLFIAGFVSNGFLGGSSTAQIFRQADARRYPLVAKEVFIKNPNDQIINFAPLRQSFNRYFDDHQLVGGLYFEYMPTGTSIRVDGEEQEVAASLLKLPAAMDLYRAAELKKIDLKQKVTLTEDMLDNSYGDLYKKGPGFTLSLQDAARIMLEDSDNTALKAIATVTADTLDPKDRSFNALDVSLTQNADLTVSVSPRGYTSFLKCLYFSCYINPAHSQELLKYLSSSDFNQRIVAGVANKDITIAHKIGVHSEDTQSDCGIVYLPNRNYALCVMLHGQNAEATDRHIAELSRQAYEYLLNK